MNPHLSANSFFNRNLSILISIGLYLIILLISIRLYSSLSYLTEPYVIFYLNLIASSLFFFVGTLFRNASLSDPYWGLFPIIVSTHWYFSQMNIEFLSFHTLVFSTICLWSVRLSLQCYNRWAGLTHEDWRYEKIRKKTRLWYPLVNWIGIHLCRNFILFFLVIPLYSFFQTDFTQNPGNEDYFAFYLMAVGLIIEAIADFQLSRFRRKNLDFSDTFLQSGLWFYSRHPNYFGEVLFWFGIFLLGWNNSWQHLYLIAGFSLLCFHFIFVAIPLMEKRLVVKKRNYAQWINKTSPLIFWLKK